MKILAIETSCDDTGISVLDIKENKNSPEFSVLSNIVASQTEIGKKYGGVYPMMAKREHQRNLVPALVQALKKSRLINSKALKNVRHNNFEEKLKILDKILEREPELAKKLSPFLKKYDLPRSKAGKPNIDLIAVTNGPGLEPCLWVGINFAKCLSYFWDIPVVPINHTESHILVNFLSNKIISKPHHIPRSSMEYDINKNLFPAIALVVSGGHTQIILMKSIGKYKILGETRDDAAGECFDKCAKILELGYPGGPEIARIAAGVRPPRTRGGLTPAKLPRPMINTKDYDFSFSGLKTAVLYHHRKQSPKTQKSKKYIQEMCVEIQQAIIDVLLKKTMKAAKDYKAKTIILGGGVSANKELRKRFQEAIREKREFLSNDKNSRITNLIFPEPDLSTDNGLMTAITGYFHRNKKVNWQKLKAKSNLRVG